MFPSLRLLSRFVPLLPIVAVALFGLGLFAGSPVVSMSATIAGIALALLAIAGWIIPMVTDPWEAAERRKQRGSYQRGAQRRA